ncbi:M24 family metallopeptidase [Planctomyces sp. SH-PL62]|uniref:M24 family metallopeptidase n=1 Tax=Planctomyces sp. SH-PL62 TaxID=1636152 RepID=UPI00078DE3C0|nr:M24 family metallopeptidase [Planctomyces sp. SH-PL62]AMV39524.1 Xaa-Pro dipeptidase [Planctomyces sp. SH-PL62]
MFDLPAIQKRLQDFGADGWLLYDFRGNNLPARRILDLESVPPGSRRFFYFIPASGEPRKLVHAIESKALDHLPGEKIIYRSWNGLEEGLRNLLSAGRRVAMEYAPEISNPYVSKVDGGTLEYVRKLGVEVASSGDLIQVFEAVWDDDQWRMHLEAEKVTTAAFDLAWRLIADRTRGGGEVRETEVQAAILDHFERQGLTTYSPPNVSVGTHSGDPHYEPSAGGDAAIRSGDFVLIDLWGKLKKPRSVYSDLTRVGYVGPSVPSRYEEVFKIVAASRDAAIDRVREAFQSGRPLHGFEVDDAARDVIRRAGYEERFIHRTGHNIGQEVHGNGANMDNLETHDERLVLPRTCFSIEPGVYFEEFGIRSEVNVFIDAENAVHVTGGLQRAVVPVLA